MEEELLLSFEEIKEYEVGEIAILNNGAMHNGEDVIILKGKKEGRFYPWNFYYLVKLVSDDTRMPYKFKVLEWDLK